MAVVTVTTDYPVQLERGDIVYFLVPSPGSQYHFAVTGGNPCIAVWNGDPWQHNGVSNNIDYKNHRLKGNYVDATLSMSAVHISFEDERVATEAPMANVPDTFVFTITKNSWWKKIFGW